MPSLSSFWYISKHFRPLKCPFTVKIFRKHQKRHLKVCLGASHSNPRFPRFRITLEHFAKATRECSTSFPAVTRLAVYRRLHIEARSSSFHLPKSRAIASHRRRDPSQNVKKPIKQLILKNFGSDNKAPTNFLGVLIPSLSSFQDISKPFRPLKVPISVGIFRKKQKRHLKTSLAANWSNARFPRFRITLKL